MKAGDLVKYVPSPSSVFKWESTRQNSHKTTPGIVLSEVGPPFSKAASSRRFVVAWNSGEVSEEWATRLRLLTTP